MLQWLFVCSSYGNSGVGGGGASSGGGGATVVSESVLRRGFNASVAVGIQRYFEIAVCLIAQNTIL